VETKGPTVPFGWVTTTVGARAVYQIVQKSPIPVWNSPDKGRTAASISRSLSSGRIRCSSRQLGSRPWNHWGQYCWPRDAIDPLLYEMHDDAIDFW